MKRPPGSLTFPAGTGRQSNVWAMLGQRRRWWAKIKSALAQLHVSTGLAVYSVFVTAHWLFLVWLVMPSLVYLSQIYKSTFYQLVYKKRTIGRLKTIRVINYAPVDTLTPSLYWNNWPDERNWSHSMIKPWNIGTMESSAALSRWREFISLQFQQITLSSNNNN